MIFYLSIKEKGKYIINLGKRDHKLFFREQQQQQQNTDVRALGFFFTISLFLFVLGTIHKFRNGLQNGMKKREDEREAK